MQAIKSNGYSVFFDNNLSELKSFLQNSSYSKIFFLTDLNTSEHCMPVIGKYLPELDNYDIIEVDPGEEVYRLSISLFPLSKVTEQSK